MRKMNILTFILALIASVIVCFIWNNRSGSPPFKIPDNTFWISDNPKICLYATGGNTLLHHVGRLYSENIDEYINITCKFPEMRTISIHYAIYGGGRVFEGNLRKRGEGFIIRVTRSYVDFVKVGDVISFYQVDELPDWAADVEESIEEQFFAEREQRRQGREENERYFEEKWELYD